MKLSELNVGRKPFIEWTAGKDGALRTAHQDYKLVVSEHPPGKWNWTVWDGNIRKKSGVSASEDQACEAAIKVAETLPQTVHEAWLSDEELKTARAKTESDATALRNKMWDAKPLATLEGRKIVKVKFGAPQTPKLGSYGAYTITTDDGKEYVIWQAMGEINLSQTK